MNHEIKGLCKIHVGLQKKTNTFQLETRNVASLGGSISREKVWQKKAIKKRRILWCEN